MRYDPVNIRNSTNFSVNGTVNYPGCKNDNYSIPPLGSWTGPGRGACLITWISGIVQTSPNPTTATRYTSSGTSYSQFAVIQIGSNPAAFEVTRRVSAADVEPTTETVETA
jgi:hypothetical protein